MSRVKYIVTSALLLFGLVRLTGQSVSLSADVLEGCYSIGVNFKANPNLDGKTLQNYLWQFGDGSTVQDTFFRKNKIYNTEGVYNVRLEMRIVGDATVYSATARVFVRPRPNANFFVADTFQLGQLSYRFFSGKAPTDTIVYIYKWTLNPDSAGSYTRTHFNANFITPGSGNRDSLLYKFSHPGMDIMRLLVTDHFGCADTFQMRFFVSETLVIPQVFTPNGDGTNDFFEVQTNGRSVFSFKVFSVTGQLVYKSESSSIVWDGKMASGSDAAPGTYLYIIESVSGEPVKKHSGFFMLLKEK
jgi:gliding motility-associated-like protein